MLALSLVAVLVAAAPEKPKLILFELTPGGGIDATVTGPLTDAIASELGFRGFFQVLTQRDMATMLSVERQKQLMGCSDNASECFSELSGAVGARFVMSGSLARLGDAYQLTLSTLDTQKAQPLGRATRVAKDLAALQAQLPFAISEATATPMPPPPSRVLPYTLMGVGAAGVVFGGVGLIINISTESQFLSELELGRSGGLLLTQTRAQYETRANQIALGRGGSIGIISAGAVLFIIGLLMNPADLPGRGAVAVVPTGNGLSFVGVFP